MNSVLALIPARGGSKRIPGKNIRSLCGLPLIAHTLHTAQAAACFTRILVSTDDQAVAAVASEHGGEVPWLRSSENAGDTSTAMDAIEEVLSRIEADGDPLPEAVMLLQPTSPFRSVRSIHRALELFARAGGESVVSVSPAANHPWWCKRLSAEGELLPFTPDAAENIRSQDLPSAYALNGLIYLASVATLRERHSLYSEHTRALVIESPEEAIDIDTPFDWLVAEAICGSHKEATA
jgi:CMP-N,N'-diacetyllegionaminic acid synthase